MKKLFIRFIALALIATITLIPFIAYVPKANASYTYPPDDPTYSEIGWMDVKRVGWDFNPNELLLTVVYQANIPNDGYYSFSGTFYLDTDQSPATGDSTGSDYCVYWYYAGTGDASQPQLYHWDSGSFVFVKYLGKPSATPGGNMVEVGVPLSDIGSPSGINVYFQGFNNFIQFVNAKYTYNTASEDRSITVDGNPSDWTGDTPDVTKSATGVTPNWGAATAFYTTDGSGKLYLRIDLSAAPPNPHPEETSYMYQYGDYIYLDTDHNPSTGQSHGGIGADYRAHVSVYTSHTSRSVWTALDIWTGTTWNPVSSATTQGAIAGTTIEASFLLSDMTLTGSTLDVYIDTWRTDNYDRFPNTGTFTATKGANPPARSLGEVSTQILSASANNVYFIYGDPYRFVSPSASWDAAFAAYDATAAGCIYGLCTSTQKIAYDSDPSMVVTKISSGNPFNYGQVLLSKYSIVVMGGPIPNWVVHYYERTGQTPLKFNGVDGFATQTGTTVASLPAGTDMKHNDIFVVEVFQDTNGNFVLLIYGYGWKGTFAGGLYFKEVMKPNLGTYTHSAYVFSWTDTNNDGVPQASEITPVYNT